MGRQVKRAFKFRFHPTDAQAAELPRTFGCVRLVYNRALEERTRAYRDEGRRVSYAESSALLTRWKRTEELAFSGEVSSVPLPEYRADWYGRTLVVADRWFPSSKLCSACGHQTAAMPLNVRERTCTCCRAVRDRDVNAAGNLLAAGPAES